MNFRTVQRTSYSFFVYLSRLSFILEPGVFIIINISCLHVTLTPFWAVCFFFFLDFNIGAYVWILLGVDSIFIDVQNCIFLLKLTAKFVALNSCDKRHLEKLIKQT